MSRTLTADLLTLYCYTRYTPPTEVFWEKDGERIPNNSSIYKFRQYMFNRYGSRYINALSVTASVEDAIGEYSCTVVNSLGQSSKYRRTVRGISYHDQPCTPSSIIFSPQAFLLSGHETPVIVGVPRTIRCTTYIWSVARMEWVVESSGETLGSRDNGPSLFLTLTLNDTALDGENLTCIVTTYGNKTFERTVSVQVKGKLASYLNIIN